MSESIFWLVWNPDGCNPSARHDSRGSAEREAERLARKVPGQRFYVLRAERFSEKYDVRNVDLGVSEDEIPF